MKVINLFAAPGIGKSTTAKILSGMLSLADYKVEFLPEFAKFATLARNQAALGDQIYMFAKQENRLRVLANTDIDFAVMDGPLPLALLFQPENYYVHYEPLVMEVFNSFDNLNFLLHRGVDSSYKTFGRNETEEQSAVLHRALVSVIGKHDISLRGEYVVDRELPAKLFEAITGKVLPWRA